MTLPFDVPTAKPPADLQPAYPPALAPPVPALPPAPLSPTAPAPDALLAVVEPAIVGALQANDPLAYFEKMCRTEPHLFYKWASLLLSTRSRPGAMQQNVINVVTAIPRSPLDELPPGFQVNG